MWKGAILHTSSMISNECFFFFYANDSDSIWKNDLHGEQPNVPGLEKKKMLEKMQCSY